jgi:SRSO17 transposase
VARQYCGALGKVGNCQVAVSTALIADGQAWPTSLELYLPQEWLDLPQEWLDDDARRAGPQIPATLGPREKWRIALSHVRTVVASGLTVDAVVADAAYGATAHFRTGLERLGLDYVLAVPYFLSARVAVGGPSESLATIATTLPPAAWHRVRGDKGLSAARFAALRVRPLKSRGERWLLCEAWG